MNNDYYMNQNVRRSCVAMLSDCVNSSSSSSTSMRAILNVAVCQVTETNEGNNGFGHSYANNQHMLIQWSSSILFQYVNNIGYTHIYIDASGE